MALAAKPKPTMHHRKRHGAHHRHSKSYVKTYWPYLPMLLIVMIGIAINTSLTRSQRVLGAQSDFSQASLLAATNAARQAAQESDLTVDPALTAAAVAKASDMAANNYWAHTSPQGKTPWSFISAAGYSYQTAGENLAYGFSDANGVVTGWMNSKEHRANILNSSYEQVGFGVASVSNYLGKGPAVIVVAEYAQPTTAVANIHFHVNGPAVEAASTAQAEPQSRLVSRLQLLSNNQPSWLGVAVIAVSASALTLFLIRHARQLKRWVHDGEVFIVKHPWFDTALVLVITIGIVVTRTSGVIR